MARRRRGPRQWQACVLLHLLSIDRRIGCDAQLLSAYEQAYGPWSIKLAKNVFHRGKWQLEARDDSAVDGAMRKRGRRKGGDSDLQLFFPEVHTPLSEKTDEANDAQNNEGEQIQTARHETIKTTTEHVRSVACVLNLEKNGRFTLSLVEDDDLSKETTQSRQSTSPLYQALKGEWFLTPNPYCVTDRFHDTLLLVSEPRLRRRAATIEKATVELRCRLWGRHGAGPVRKKLGFGHGRVCGRMTHGTVLIVKEELLEGGGEKKRLPTREIVGTFRGRTLVPVVQ